jgi:ABC-type lipoprotein release transport system permease subunit
MTLTVTALAVIVGVYSTLAGVAEGLNRAMGEAGSARNLILLDARTILPDDASIAPQIVAEAGGIPGVTEVVPMLYRLVRVGQSSLHVRGLPLESYGRALDHSLLRGRELAESRGVMIGEGLANLRGWDLGDELNIAGEDVTVIGVFRADGPRNSEMWMLLDDARRLLDRDEGYSQILLLLGSGADPEAARMALDAHPAMPNVQAYFEDAYYRESNTSLSQLHSVALMVSAVALIAMIFGVFNAVSMATTEQRRDVAILKSVGISQTRINGIFLVQGLTLAMAGLAAGLCMGLATVWWLGASSALNLADVTVRPILTTRHLAVGAFATLLLGSLGAFLPARSAAATNVADVLRA